MSTQSVVKKKKLVQVSPTYHLTLKFNGFVYDFDTNDIVKEIKSVEPEFLRTKVVVIVSKDGKVFDRLIPLQAGKKLFRDKLVQETLLRNIKLVTHECI